ncbi:MAG: BatD family protein [Gammaproteobacteria bacterium]|nr:BatD family protein [Gammaproteobacteria bacterium]
MPNPGNSVRQSDRWTGYCRLCICVFCLCLSVVGYAQQEIVEARISSDVITIDDSVTLQIITNSASDDVDFTELQKDFDVIARSNSQQVQIVNGSQQRIQTWVLELVPKDVGVFTIPAISVGRALSNPVQVTVSEASVGSARILFLTAEVDKSSVYVQEQVLLTIKVHEAVEVFDQQITSLRHDDLVIHNLGREAESVENIDGQQYRVRSQRFALFPQKSGTLEIPSLLMSASVPRDPQAVQGFFRDSKWIKRRTPAIELTVKPRPESHDSSWWLPAQQVEIHNRWTPRTAVQSVTEVAADGQLLNVAPEEDQEAVVSFNRGSAVLKVDIDQPITRVIKLSGVGVGPNQLPELPLPEIDGLDLYSEDLSSNVVETAEGINTVQDTSWAIIAQRPGTFELPELKIEWFNTDTEQIESAVLPPQTIEVVGEAVSAAMGADDDQSVEPTRPSETDSLVASDSLSASSVAATATSAEASTTHHGGFWRWLALLLGLGWVATALAFLVWSRRTKTMQTRDTKTSPEPKAVMSVKDRQSALTQLREAITARSAHATLTETLNWGSAVWPQDPPGHLSALSTRLSSAQLDWLCRALDAELYRPEDGTSSSGVWQTLSELPTVLEQSLTELSENQAQKRTSANGLPEL